MNCSSALFAILLSLPVPGGLQEPDLTPDQLLLLEALLEDEVITQAEFDRRTGRGASSDTSQDPPLTAEQVALLESLLEDGVISQEEFDRRVKPEPEPVAPEGPALTADELALLRALLEDGVITEAEFNERGGNNPIAAASGDSVLRTDTEGVGGRSSGAPVRLRLLYRDLEYGSFDSDLIDGLGFVVGAVEVPDVSVERVGLQFDLGEVSCQAYKEDLLGIYDLVGLGVGTEQQEVLGGGGGPAAMVLEWGVGLNVAFGNGDVPLYNEFGQEVGTVDQGLWYTEVHGKIGAGVAFSPVTLVSGLELSLARGEFNSDLGTGEFDGSNLGLYLGARSELGGDEFVASVDAYLGDISGVAVTVGLSL